ncbi:ATPase GET3 [Hondaea fermentalgiana]|uniref:ATPase GET3 n=1 Tax=Hondaea fermentalgiana TaxID=2315210 RepID=A0A2R5GRN1_9STRA|nr:ATPase GET3 [Hondaea fermentalgiana]|eukprot:GBG33537.1 ATPase GET3 [Hondaea fermentalgiana]
MQPRLLNEVERQRFIFVGGKGGVGKTTVSASLAVGLAKTHERVLIISTDPAHNLSDVLCAPVGKEIGRVPGYDNLWAVETDPAKGLERFLREHANSNQQGQQQQHQQQQSLDAQISSAFQEAHEWLSSLPGIDEAVSLMQLFETEKSLHERFDKLVIDTAPTGHTLKMLQLPRVLEIGISRLESWKVKLSGYIAMASMFFGGAGSAQAQPLASEQVAAKLRRLKEGIQQLRALLQDGDVCTFVCVGIAESLSVLETGRLVSSLETAKVDSHVMIVNKLLPEIFASDIDNSATSTIKHHNDKDQASNGVAHATGTTEDLGTSTRPLKTRRIEPDPAAVALALCEARARTQKKYLAALLSTHGATHRVFGIEELAFEPTGQEHLDRFLMSASAKVSPALQATAAPFPVKESEAATSAT